MRAGRLRDRLAGNLAAGRGRLADGRVPGPGWLAGSRARGRGRLGAGPVLVCAGLALAALAAVVAVRPALPSPPALPLLPGGLVSLWDKPSGWWRAAPGPAAGVVAEVSIPGTTSGFTARPAEVYLPPAARTPHPPALPVLLLLPGRPGSPPATTAPDPAGEPPVPPDAPRDWVASGGLAAVLDAYAAAHHGLAPIVVVADPFGVGPDNPLCADSPTGNAASYLTVDVPAWVRAHLPAADRPWAVGGYASGGTCAVQLAMRDPVRFPTFVDLAGQDAPTLGSRELTVARLFGGDALAYARVNPADIVARQQFRRVAGFLAAGRDDVPYNDQTRTMTAICQAGGIATQFYSIKGGHDWAAWRLGLQLSLPWVALRLGLR